MKISTFALGLSIEMSRIFSFSILNSHFSIKQWIMSDSIVIIPTYNEKENIENIIRVVFGLEKEFHILIIDDDLDIGNVLEEILKKEGYSVSRAYSGTEADWC